MSRVTYATSDAGLTLLSGLPKRPPKHSAGSTAQRGKQLPIAEPSSRYVSLHYFPDVSSKCRLCLASRKLQS
ncbi:hypothetical protein I79_000827 [Cricetulus griseus]|uniref:Uncharacterized protein n=1 Tax=Cricetulus griseus TaxID=10029 RepID=G3GT53_CRIGR|nr:hypothetical protein I79_000827 [Cricetulus griseus]